MCFYMNNLKIIYFTPLKTIEYNIFCIYFISIDINDIKHIDFFFFFFYEMYKRLFYL